MYPVIPFESIAGSAHVLSAFMTIVVAFLSLIFAARA